MGIGFYRNSDEAFASLDLFAHVEPDMAHREEYLAAYARWKETLEQILK
jgi:xylulokinase